jgi:hypothetical protein
MVDMAKGAKFRFPTEIYPEYTSIVAVMVAFERVDGENELESADHPARREAISHYFAWLIVNIVV